MKNMKYISVIFLLFICVGCTPKFIYSSNNLQKGLSKTDVVDSFGEPSERRIFNRNDVYVYYLHNSIFDLIFSNKFPYIGFFPLNRTGKEYWIVFDENGRLKYFGKSNELLNRIEYEKNK